MKRNTCTCTPTNHEYKHHLGPRQGSLGLPKVFALIVTGDIKHESEGREILLLLLWMVVTRAGEGQ